MDIWSSALGVQDLKTGRGENGPGSAARARDELQVSHWGHGGVAAGLFAGVPLVSLKPWKIQHWSLKFVDFPGKTTSNFHWGCSLLPRKFASVWSWIFHDLPIFFEGNQWKIYENRGAPNSLVHHVGEAEQLAQSAEFFSFGSNDLTQSTYGLSRDDASTFLPPGSLEKMRIFDWNI